MSYALARAPGSQPPASSAKPMSASQKATQFRKAQQRFRSMVIFAKMLGLTWNVQVVFDPSISTACTDKKTIRLRPCSIGDEEDAILMEGLLDHEAGVHCRQTDFELLNRWAPKVPEITKNLWNICEDVWGERELYRLKPGCARSINSALEILVKRGLYGHASEDLHPSATLINGLLGGLRYTRLRQAVLRDFYESNWALAEKHFGLQLAGKVWSVAEDIDDVNSTAGAITLSERIVRLLKDYLQEPPPPPPSPPAPSSCDKKHDGDSDKSDSPQGKSGQSPQSDPGDDDSGSGQNKSSPADGGPSEVSDDQTSDSSGSSGDDSHSGDAGDGDQRNETGQGNQAGSDADGNDGSNGNSPSTGKPGNGDAHDQGDDSGSDGSGGSQGSPRDAAGKGSDSGSGSSGNVSSVSETLGCHPQSDSQPSGSQNGENNGGSAAPGSSQQSQSVVSPDKGSDKGSKSNDKGTAEPQQPSAHGAPDQKPISSNNQKPGDEPTVQGDAAPQPAPMTPEEFQNALRAIQATISARTADSGSGELGDAVSDALGNSKAPAEARALGISAGNQWDLGSAKLAPNPSVDSVISEISRPIAVRLGSKLDSLLEAQTTANTHTKRQGRRIAHGKLVGVVTSAKQRIFKATDDVEELDTVTLILTDISASMTAPMGQVGTVGAGNKPVTRIGGAVAVTRALGDVLSRFNVLFGISYFGACLTTLKKFDDNWRLKKELYWTQLESSTCTDQALIGVIPELAARSEGRKLLVLVTDGIPANAQAAALALSEARKLGIDCCVVIVTAAGTSDTGLQAFKAALDNFGISHATATAVDELAQTVFDAVKQAF